MANVAKFKDPSSNFVAEIEFVGSAPRVKLAKEILASCSTLQDVQRCAEMGDFRITGYDLA